MASIHRGLGAARTQMSPSCLGNEIVPDVSVPRCIRVAQTFFLYGWSQREWVRLLFFEVAHIALYLLLVSVADAEIFATKQTAKRQVLLQGQLRPSN